MCLAITCMFKGLAKECFAESNTSELYYRTIKTNFKPYIFFQILLFVLKDLPKTLFEATF